MYICHVLPLCFSHFLVGAKLTKLQRTCCFQEFFFSFPAWGGWATCCLCCFIWVVRLEDKKSCCWKDFFDALRRAAFFGWCNMVSPCKTASFRRTYPLNQTIVLRCQQWCFHGPWHLLDSSFNRRCDVGTGSNISNCQPEIKHLHVGLDDSLLSTYDMICQCFGLQCWYLFERGASNAFLDAA